MSDMQKYFDYLDVLRESGVTNMFGAPMYLVDKFGIGRYEARKITTEWMAQFERKEPQRASA